MLVVHKPRGLKVSEDFRKWLAALREDAGLSRNQLADLSGVDQGTVSRVESGKREPTDEYLSRVARLLRQDAANLITLAAADRAGIRDPRSGQVLSSQEGSNHGRVMVSGETMTASEFQPRATEGMPAIGGPRMVDVPVYGPVACGVPFMWTPEEAIGYERLSADDAKVIDVVLVVAGDSLSAERINDGDRLGVQRLNGEQPPDGAIVVVEVEGSYMAKVYRRNQVGEYLESRRIGRDPEPLLLGDEVRLIGRARKHIRNL